MMNQLRVCDPDLLMLLMILKSLIEIYPNIDLVNKILNHFPSLVNPKSRPFKKVKI